MLVLVFVLILMLAHLETSHQTAGFTTKPIGYWNAKRKNMRTFFEAFAKNRNLDPLLPNTWYSVSREFMEQKVLNSIELLKISGLPLYYFQEAKYILAHFSNRSYVKAVMHLFPDIGLKESKFKILPCM